VYIGVFVCVRVCVCVCARGGVGACISVCMCVYIISAEGYYVQNMKTNVACAL